MLASADCLSLIHSCFSTSGSAVNVVVLLCSELNVMVIWLIFMGISVQLVDMYLSCILNTFQKLFLMHVTNLEEKSFPFLASALDVLRCDPLK